MGISSCNYLISVRRYGQILSVFELSTQQWPLMTDFRGEPMAHVPEICSKSSYPIKELYKA